LRTAGLESGLPGLTSMPAYPLLQVRDQQKAAEQLAALLGGIMA
jgi:hypothetical protein